MRTAAVQVLALLSGTSAALVLQAGPAAPSLLRFTPPLLCTVPPEGGWESYEWFEDGVSCVEYEDATSGELRLGVYNAYNMLDSEPHIRPLCVADEDEGITALFCDEEVPAVALSAVRRVLDLDYTYVSERQAGGGQGLGNPHGEHAEPVYDLRDVEVSEEVTLVLRENRDTERVL